MSIITGVSDTAKVYKKWCHRRKDSDELDVFEAARYFSGQNEASSGYHNEYGATYADQKDDKHYTWRRSGGRMSLDVVSSSSSSISNIHPLAQVQQTHHHIVVDKQQILKEKKHYKQPSSPGARLASFLNSLFSQSGSRKKKSKPTTRTQSMKDHEEGEESPDGRRKRRSSISHFRSSWSTATKSHDHRYTSPSGFRTPPPAYNSHTPTKSFRDTIISDHHHKHQVSKSKHAPNLKEQGGLEDLSWLDDKLKLLHAFSSDNNNNNNSKYRTRTSRTHRDDRRQSKDKDANDDDEDDTDSSSDLFELQNYDLGLFSTGLPVYETTHMGSIKIPNAATS
ncbi:hypothetical protein Tsubulata_023220 [Turnera subulata]|uniref:Protein BIG GRAIN 1-like E n=1 Tax=Turnera subulata TaxID=218843 RepID=A0A9Q0FIP7_9ROSI|nr:hypothetical protein Tsubulata_023220 [Turnera subulata]